MAAWCGVVWCGVQLTNTTTDVEQTVIADKCFIVWNASTSSTADSWNETAVSTRRLACPHGWTYDPQPIQTSIVTDVRQYCRVDMQTRASRCNSNSQSAQPDTTRVDSRVKSRRVV